MSIETKVVKKWHTDIKYGTDIAANPIVTTMEIVLCSSCHLNVSHVYINELSSIRQEVCKTVSTYYKD